MRNDHIAKTIRRTKALDRLYEAPYERSKASKTPGSTYEKWDARRLQEISTLSSRIHTPPRTKAR